ncbi:MAG: preprotein translocase subunit SecG [Cyclobacteriaceae bacterium]
MYGLIVGIIILVAFLLILVVLAQNPKGGGLSSQFGGSGAQQVMGVKKTGDILEKMTWGLAIGLLVLTLSTNFFIEENVQTLSSPNIESAQESVLPPQNIAPAAGSDLNDLGLDSDSTN